MTHSGPQPRQNPALQHAPNAPQNGTSLLGRPLRMPVTSRAALVPEFQGAYTLRSVDNVEKLLSGLDRTQWRHTLRIVHRHYRAFQRGRRGATLRKGRSMMGQA